MTKEIIRLLHKENTETLMNFEVVALFPTRQYLWKGHVMLYVPCLSGIYPVFCFLRNSRSSFLPLEVPSPNTKAKTRLLRKMSLIMGLISFRSSKSCHETECYAEAQRRFSPLFSPNVASALKSCMSVCAAWASGVNSAEIFLCFGDAGASTEVWSDELP